MKHKIEDPKDYEDDILHEGQESVGEVEDEELYGSNGTTESDSSATRAESPSAELSPRLPPSSTTLFTWPTLAKKAPGGTLNKNGGWVIEALAIGDDSANEKEKTLWKGVIH